MKCTIDAVALSMNKSFTTIVSGIVIISALQIWSATKCWATANERLENYSIKFLPHSESNSESLQPKKLNEKSQPTVGCVIFMPKKPHIRFFTLTKPNKNNVVAILKIEPNGLCVLNPKGWGDYGPIPPLNKLELRDADLLWGPPDESQNQTSDRANNRTYKLVFLNKQLDITFHLDTEFNNKCLSRYRFRCDTDGSIVSRWHLLTENGGGAKPLLQAQ